MSLDKTVEMGYFSVLFFLVIYMRYISIGFVKVFIWIFFIFIFGVSVLSVFSTRVIEAEDRFVADEQLENSENDFLSRLITIDLSLSAPEDVEQCKRIAESTLMDFSEYLVGFKSLNIHEDKSKRRGLSNGEEIFIRCLDDKDEYLNVLLHELGHTVDLLYLHADKESSESAFRDFNKPVFESDDSVDYYSISWENSFLKKDLMKRSDFVSGYAMTDPFEDFAESFLFYVRYGEVFRFLIENNDNQVLTLKYDFFKDVVFQGHEFNLGKPLSDKAFLIFSNKKSNIFDVTKLEDLV